MIELLLLAIIVLIYFPCLNGMPIYDDQQLFQNQIWKWSSMKKPHLRWIPMMTLAATFNHVPVKYQLQVLHLTSAVFHWMNALLVKQVALHYMDPVSASVVMIGYGVHPLAGAAVAPIATRSMILSMTFTLLGILSIQHGLVLLAAPCVLAAVFCREDAVAIVPLMVILALQQSPLSAIVLLASFAGIALVMPIRKTWIWLMARKGDRGMLAAGITDSFPQPIYTMTSATENILRWPLWALGFGMNPDPLLRPITLRSWKFYGALALMAAALFLLWTGPPVLKLAILVMGFSPWTATWFVQLPDGVAESRAYASVLAPPLMLGWLWWPLGLLVCLLWILLACRRSFQQRHPVPYWLSAWREREPKFRVALNLGAAFQAINDMDNARQWHLKALGLQPSNGIAMANLGLWHEGLSRVERHLLAQGYVHSGKLDAQEADLRNQQSLTHLAHAVEWMEKAEKACPNDKVVQQYTKMVRESAERVGLKKMEEASV